MSDRRLTDLVARGRLDRLIRDAKARLGGKLFVEGEQLEGNWTDRKERDMIRRLVDTAWEQVMRLDRRPLVDIVVRPAEVSRWGVLAVAERGAVLLPGFAPLELRQRSGSVKKPPSHRIVNKAKFGAWFKTWAKFAATMPRSPGYGEPKHRAPPYVEAARLGGASPSGWWSHPSSSEVYAIPTTMERLPSLRSLRRDPQAVWQRLGLQPGQVILFPLDPKRPHSLRGPVSRRWMALTNAGVFPVVRDVETASTTDRVIRSIVSDWLEEPVEEVEP